MNRGLVLIASYCDLIINKSPLQLSAEYVLESHCVSSAAESCNEKAYTFMWPTQCNEIMREVQKRKCPQVPHRVLCLVNAFYHLCTAK